MYRVNEGYGLGMSAAQAEGQQNVNHKVSAFFPNNT
jgi:hypothetical protein